MHRQITFSGDSTFLAAAARDLAEHDDVISLSRSEGGSLKPVGDVLVLEVLNRGVDDVLRRAASAVRAGTVVLAVSKTSALVHTPKRDAINHDADETIWEEIEAGLRNHGRLTLNFCILMLLGGAVACIGLSSDPVTQATAFVGSAVIAPGYEPFAKLAQGLFFRQGFVIRRALLACLCGYVLIGLGGALTQWLLLRTGGSSAAVLASVPSLESLATPHLKPTFVSVCAALAGALMIVTQRDLYIMGPLIVLVLIPGASLAGAALVSGNGSLAADALLRVGLDALAILVVTLLVLFWKQKRHHQRQPLS